MSSKARGVREADLKGKPVELSMPNRLVQLAAEAGRVPSNENPTRTLRR